MEKKTMETLQNMICEELEDIAKKGTLSSHETLDILKDLLDSAKNLEKIEKYKREKEESEKETEVDMGYSQRKYYIDADYDPYHPTNSYARGGRGDYRDGNSYAMPRPMYNRNMDSYMDGNSYLYYDPRYEQTPMYPNGYSRHGDKQELISGLQEMMGETKDEAVKKAISDVLGKIK